MTTPSLQLADHDAHDLAIATTGLRKSYLSRRGHRQVAVEGLDLRVPTGGVHGFLGPNIGGAAKAVADTRTAQQATGITEVEWWRVRSGLLEELAIDETWPERYPTITRLRAARVFDQPDRHPDDASDYLEHEEITAFEFGLSLLLDGLATRIDPGISRRP